MTKRYALLGAFTDGKRLTEAGRIEFEAEDNANPWVAVDLQDIPPNFVSAALVEITKDGDVNVPIPPPVLKSALDNILKQLDI